MKIRINISKKRAGKLAVFAALIGMAVFFDHYFEKNPVKLDQFSNKTGQAATEHGAIYLFSQNSSTTLKTSVQKTPDRKIFQQSHNKLLQKYHHLKSYQVVKREAKIQKPLFILTCHFLLFRNYHFTIPGDDVPLPA